jgi:hypothetical protein
MAIESVNPATGALIEGFEEFDDDNLERALEHEGPSLLAIPIDYRENLKLGERLGNLQRTL